MEDHHFAVGGQTRFVIVTVGFAAIPLVGYIDGQTSAYIAFSIFYLVPIFLIAWFGNRLLSILAAAACGVCGLLADIWTIGARHVYAYANLGLRIALFLVVGLMVERLRSAIDIERKAAAAERQLAKQQHQISELQRRVMIQVARDSLMPLGEIRAKVVDLAFDHDTLSAEDARGLVADLATASARVSELLASLEDVERRADRQVVVTTPSK